MKDKNDKPLERAYNIVFVGDSYVGKTCIRNIFCHFPSYSNHSLAVDIEQTPNYVEKDEIYYVMNIWDTSGMENLYTLSFAKRIVFVLFMR